MILALIVLAAAAVTAGAQRVDKDVYSAETLSRMYPGMMIRDYDRVWMDGVNVPDYKLYDFFPYNDYRQFARGKNLYRASEWVAAGGVAAILAGGVLLSLSKTGVIAPEYGKAGASVAGGGAAALCLSLPLNISGQKKIRAVTNTYNETRLANN